MQNPLKYIDRNIQKIRCLYDLVQVISIRLQFGCCQVKQIKQKQSNFSWTEVHQNDINILL